METYHSQLNVYKRGCHPFGIDQIFEDLNMLAM
jgi:hypothetical protein